MNYNILLIKLFCKLKKINLWNAKFFDINKKLFKFELKINKINKYEKTCFNHASYD